jgi:hypothetical protein
VERASEHDKVGSQYMLHHVLREASERGGTCFVGNSREKGPASYALPKRFSNLFGDVSSLLFSPHRTPHSAKIPRQI